MSNSALTVTSPALTVSVWFNAANLSNANPRLVANSHTDIDAKGFQLMFNSGGASGFFDVGNGTAEGRASWSQQLVEGTWYHYVGVYNGATVSAYLNGVQVASAAFAGGAIAAGAGPDINIARNPTNGLDFFIGAMSDVRIYKRGLSAAEILALYRSVTPPPPSGPTAEWTLTQASVSGATVADASGNGNAGTVINGPLTFGAMGANFNGTNQYLDNSTVNSTGWSAITVSAWFNATAFTGAPPSQYPSLVANSHPYADNAGFDLHLTNSGAGGAFFDVGNGTTFARANGTSTLTTGTWYFLVGTYDGATVTVYLNGSQVASTAFAGGAIAAGTGPHINVAQNPAFTGNYFPGAIYDVRIYNRALSSAEILALYQAVPPPTPTAITVSPASATIADNAPAGTLVASASVTMSDGSQFTGTLTTSNTNLFAISGLNIVTARALTAADDGAFSTLITASQGSHALSVEFSI